MSFLRRIRKLLCPDVESFAKDAEQGHPDSIKQRGWLQWSCVGSADLPSTLRSTALDLELASLSTDVRLLIVSQSCDLVHHSYESEPFAEAYLCEALAVEEPENGIHPARIPSMIKLLKDIAVDVSEQVDSENPLRQVIINTHSPAVVKQVPEETVLFAKPKESIREGKRFNGVRFSCLSDTWRAKKLKDHKYQINICKMGDLLAYLNPVLASEFTEEYAMQGKKSKRIHTRRVIDRPDVQPYLPYRTESLDQHE